MESSKQASRNLVIAGVVMTLIVLGVAAYFVTATPPQSQVTLKVPLTSPSASASSSAAALKSVSAPTVRKPAPISDPAPPGEPPSIHTKEQAAAALMALPELQAWSAVIEKTSGGKAHGGLLEYDPAPRKLNGKNYFQFSFVENTAESAMRWESFLVSASDDEILVEDASSDEVISLARWRREKHPAKRTSIDG
jgi:hypothetical protein